MPTSSISPEIQWQHQLPKIVVPLLHDISSLSDCSSYPHFVALYKNKEYKIENKLFSYKSTTMQNRSYNFESRLPQSDLFLFLVSLIKNSFAITKIPMADSSAEFSYVPASPYLKKINGVANHNRKDKPITIYI